MFNKYTIEARIYPTIISSLPLLLLQYTYLSKYTSSFLIYLGSLSVFGDISISLALVYCVSQLNRIISKAFFERKELYMPSTEILLYKNNYFSDEYKERFYSKVQKNLKINLPARGEQERNELNSRKVISEAIGIIRKKVGSGKLLLQHNIEYGFWRNLSGGSILAVIISFLLLNDSLSKQEDTVLILSATFLGVFGLILCCNQFFIGRAGELYARVLIQEYMANDDM